jgi:signal transduction histidine kinase
MRYPAKALDDAPLRAVLPGIPLFSHIADELLRTIADAGRAVAVDAGEIVFREGDPGDSLYTVLTGELRISKQLADGSEIELRRAGPGDSFGELTLLDGGARSATVQSLTSCQLFTLSREAFLAALPGSPKLLSTVLTNLVEYVRASTEHMLRAELEQRAIRAEMETEKYRALTQMVAGVAHEINTPLGIVNTAASVVSQRMGSEAMTQAAADPAARRDVDDIREAVGLISANIQRAHKLIRDFKQLSVSQLADVRETLSLVDVIEEVIGLFIINARQARLEIHVRNALPDRAAASWTGYRGFLTQVLLNLLTNVERYAYPEGTGGQVDILVGEAPGPAKGPAKAEHYNESRHNELRKEAHFTVTVRDFGRGMAPEEVSRVFEPFYTTGRGKGATGLGMAIVHNLVTSALYGSVDVASEPGRGTAVTLSLPKTIPE